MVFGVPSHGDLFLSNTSPVAVGEAICLLLCFSNLKVNNKKLIKLVSFVTPSIFSVYIIHVHPIVFWSILKDSFTWLTEYNVLISFVLIMAISFVILVGCIVLDFIRIAVFKLFKVDYYCGKIHVFAKQKFDRIRGLL